MTESHKNWPDSVIWTIKQVHKVLAENWSVGVMIWWFDMEWPCRDNFAWYARTHSKSPGWPGSNIEWYISRETIESNCHYCSDIRLLLQCAALSLVSQQTMQRVKLRFAYGNHCRAIARQSLPVMIIDVAIHVNQCERYPYSDHRQGLPSKQILGDSCLLLQ